MDVFMQGFHHFKVEYTLTSQFKTVVDCTTQGSDFLKNHQLIFSETGNHFMSW